MQIAYQLQSLETDYEVQMEQLRVLLNAATRLSPRADGYLYFLTSSLDTTKLSLTPALKMYEQKISLAQMESKLEKAKMLPSFNAGINSSTIIGWQTTAYNTEQYFGSGARFNTISAGIGIPLFYGAQQAKIRAANNLTRQKEIEYQASRQQVSSELGNALRIYNQRKDLVSVYQKNMLPNASRIMEAANQKLRLGEIGYLDWTILINQALQVQGEYLNIAQQMNEAGFEVEKICGVK